VETLAAAERRTVFKILISGLVYFSVRVACRYPVGAGLIAGFDPLAGSGCCAKGAIHRIRFNGATPFLRGSLKNSGYIMKSKFELFRKRAFGILEMHGFSVWDGDLSAVQYELILEAELKEVVDQVVFWVNLYAGGKQFITEIRLDHRDTFIANEWGLFLLNTDGSDDVTFEEHTFEDMAYFSKEEAEEAGIFYNADLSLIINNLIVLPGVRTDRFRKYQRVQDRRELGESGLQEIEGTLLLLTGSKNVFFKLDLPRKTNWKDSGTRLRLRLGGLLFRNSTIIT
jgi:hypothetical protein